MANQELYSSNSSFFLIGNIPASLHAADLRAFFSRLIEGGVFLCFHYKHRPEHSKDGAATTTSDTPTKCCVAVLKKGREEERDFFKDYSNKNWFGSNGDPLRSKVRIQSLTVVNKDKTPHATSAMLWSDLRPLSELNPPSLMPQGNVGTPLQTFMGLIQSCKLPTHIIKKLRLEFPKSRSTRRYGAVKLDYSNHGNWKEGDGETNVTHGQGANSDKDSSDSEIPSDDDHDAEEWERYESLHNDVDKQGRVNERLFEEEMEVVWEKGGSGLVFYTDSAYWQEQEGDFDEQCSKEDDWNVDTGLYYGGHGDREAVAHRDMDQETRLREGKDSYRDTWDTPAGFEKHTKGFGSRVLKRCGWKEGQGVGATNQGVPTPVEAEGQHPAVKSGLGYRGEQLNRGGTSAKRKCPISREILISTVYDQPGSEGGGDTVLRSGIEGIKYRTNFRAGGLLNPQTKTHS